jgi:hypothetical protein
LILFRERVPYYNAYHCFFVHSAHPTIFNKLASVSEMLTKEILFTLFAYTSSVLAQTSDGAAAGGSGSAFFKAACKDKEINAVCKVKEFSGTCQKRKVSDAHLTGKSYYMKYCADVVRLNPAYVSLKLTTCVCLTLCVRRAATLARRLASTANARQSSCRYAAPL